MPERHNIDGDPPEFMIRINSIEISVEFVPLVRKKKGKSEVPITRSIWQHGPDKKPVKHCLRQNAAEERSDKDGGEEFI
jgi:hypothetical protein